MGDCAIPDGRHDGIKEVSRIFDGKVDLIIDGGDLKKTNPSTLYSVLENRIIRKGPISEKQIKALGL